ncbi:MAG: SGNH/GDSL hydrolase family protein [Pseudomonas sp.]|uniref:SGNH/GDSL hydrolase family protein n=1 Tax=Pseudomonas sp. TaxID=306 RepID=UPI0033952A36
MALPLLPLLVPLAVHTRRTALRLPPASGPTRGVAGAHCAGTPLRLLLVGESTVVGVGVATLEQALPGQLAVALSRALARPVCWRICGENGITVDQARQRLLPSALAEPADLAVLVFGVNDSTRLTAPLAWERALGEMAQALGAQGAQVAFTAVPPLQHFSALPWLLRHLLGARARLLNRHLGQLAARLNLARCTVDLEFSPAYLALDGYHPSALGYRVWAEGLVTKLRASAVGA